jgi:hypothetical protein
MKIVYWHEDTFEVQFIKKIYSLRTWKVYARLHADWHGDLCLMRQGRTLRCATRIRHGVQNGRVISTYQEWKV